MTNEMDNNLTNDPSQSNENRNASETLQQTRTTFDSQTYESEQQTDGAQSAGFWNATLSAEKNLCGLCGFFTSPEIKKLSKNWFPFLLLGITLIVLGFLAIGSTFFATILTIAAIGVFLMIGGIMQILNSFYTGRWSGFFLHLALGILYLVVGFMLLDAPMLNAITLTFLLAGFFIVVGLFRIIGSLSTQFPGWGWALFSGTITFLLGVLIYKHWPSSGLWVIGLFVGIEMIFSGWYWVIFASGLRVYQQQQRQNTPSTINA
ncbi:MAG: HdeD family acid-resistance protein [Planctomycetia bacterium]|nr:HdeD family acid-resistance protein [Planctomycetia bacterium]